MPQLTEAEALMVAEVVNELSKLRGTSFDKAATGFRFARAALIDPAFKAQLAKVHRRLRTRRSTNIPDKLLVPIGPLFRDLERRAESVLRGWTDD